MKKLNKFEQLAHDKIIEYLTANGPTPTVELMPLLVATLRGVKFGQDDDYRKLFCTNLMRHMRKHKLIYSVGKRFFTPEGSIKRNICLVIDIRPEEKPKYECSETLEAMQRQARFYLETRQFEKMGLGKIMKEGE